MTKITQKKLIEQMKMLKEIKPRKEWAVLLKSQILSEQKEITPVQAQSAGFENFISNFKFQISNSFSRRLAYSFAVILFLVVGVFGFARYTVPGDLLFPVKKIAEQSQAALTGQSGLKQNVATLNSRINDLAQVAKNGRTGNIPSAISEVAQAAKDLKDNSIQDPNTLKEIASSLKTLADVPGTDLSANSDVKDLYQTVVQSQIADMQKATLTDDQQKTLTQAEDLYGQGKYEQAFEILLTSK